MDERFRSAYGRIYESRTGPFPFEGFPEFPEEGTARSDAGYGPFFLRWAWDRDVPRLIRDAVDAAEREAQGHRLREDAKALLAVNFEELVLLPLALGGGVDIGELNDDVRRDIALLVKEASRRAKSDELSSHAIIDALSQSWADLRISRFRLWEQT